jgi:hypothetical protein
MNSEIRIEIAELGGDITVQEWQWLINNGPHGNSFTWSQTKGEPPGYVGVEHLERIISEKNANDPDFIYRTRKVVEIALKSSNLNLLLRAIQVGALVGSEKELATITTLIKHNDDLVRKHAKASVFYLKKRFKSLLN